jgi:protein ImuB
LVETALAALARAVTETLAGRGEGGRRFVASFFRSDGAVRRVGIETAEPCRDAAALMRLLRTRLDLLADPLDPGFGFDGIRLSVPEAEPLGPLQPGFDGRAVAERAVADLIDRLSVRFGRERVERFVTRDTHDPVRAGGTVPALAAPAPAPCPAAPAGEPPLRPLQVFDPPEPVEVLAEVPDGPPLRFRWRRVLHEVARAEGPERIAPEWWREGAGATARDYYRVEDREGRRFWLCREGLYGPAPPPRWFVQGLFA